VDLDKEGETDGARQKIAQWYWCGVLGELYGGATETRFARDLPEVVAWLKQDGIVPITVQESNFQAGRLLTLRTRNSAAYKGIYALLMRDGGRDFRTGEPIEAQTFFDDKMDIHHIFPEKWCKEAGIKSEFYNSIINKTVLSAQTNRQIGGKAPSKYLPVIEKRAVATPERMDEILQSHCIAFEHIRADSFWNFYKARAEALLNRIEAATGKVISYDPELFQEGAAMETYDVVQDEWDEEETLEESALQIG
jgi:hypothetical protein